MSNVRLNPTLNGLPHLGHAYLALVNQHAARSTGGRFYFRGEDDQAYWLVRHPAEEQREFGRRWVDDMAWLGIEFDAVHYESDMMADGAADHLIHQVYPDAVDTVAGDYGDCGFPLVVGGTHDWYPYTRYLTAKVRILDYALGIDTLIVGRDLLPRFSLYCEVSMLLGFPLIRQVFLPRLTAGGELDSVSKTHGNHKIGTYRAAGFTPDDVLCVLRASCLKDIDGGWDWANVKADPVLVL